MDPVLYTGKWLVMKSKEVVTRSNTLRKWEYVERKNKSSLSDGVEVVATLGSRIILVAVYRYPINNFVLEFPAGLSEGLDPVSTAIKELKEETGYTAYPDNVLFTSPTVYIDPWKSTEATTYVGITVPDIPANSNPLQELENEEQITVELLELEGLLENIKVLCEQKGYFLSSQLYCFAQGLFDSKKA
jgi:ADP-ribose pyrophosphatase